VLRYDLSVMSINSTATEVSQRRVTDPLEELRRQIKRTVQALEPAAEIILYGSRARGDAAADSDWDLLILVDGPVDAAREQAIRHHLYELEWDSDEVISSVVCSRLDWNSPLYRAMPFHRNVDHDGIVL
jgi:predicted nucleotidyltransferase